MHNTYIHIYTYNMYHVYNYNICLIQCNIVTSNVI